MTIEPGSLSSGFCFVRYTPVLVTCGGSDSSLSMVQAVYRMLDGLEQAAELKVPRYFVRPLLISPVLREKLVPLLLSGW